MTADGEQRVIALLTEIRDLLAGPIAGSGVPDPEPECEHPEDGRINLLAMGDAGAGIREFFRCGRCKRTIRR